MPTIPIPALRLAELAYPEKAMEKIRRAIALHLCESGLSSSVAAEVLAMKPACIRGMRKRKTYVPVERTPVVIPPFQPGRDAITTARAVRVHIRNAVAVHLVRGGISGPLVASLLGMNVSAVYDVAGKAGVRPTGRESSPAPGHDPDGAVPC